MMKLTRVAVVLLICLFGAVQGYFLDNADDVGARGTLPTSTHTPLLQTVRRCNSVYRDCYPSNLERPSWALNKASWEIPSVEKRSVSLVAKGKAAVEYLLQGLTKLNPSSTAKWRRYDKEGDLADAERDFRAVVDPATLSVQKLKDGRYTMKGLVGDRKLILISRGFESRPTLQVIDSYGRKPIEEIIYFKKQQ